MSSSVYNSLYSYFQMNFYFLVSKAMGLYLFNFLYLPLPSLHPFGSSDLIFVCLIGVPGHRGASATLARNHVVRISLTDSVGSRTGTVVRRPEVSRHAVASSSDRDPRTDRVARISNEFRKGRGLFTLCDESPLADSHCTVTPRFLRVRSYRKL